MGRIKTTFRLIFLFFPLISLMFSCGGGQSYDLLIKNGLIVDGTGEKAYAGDIAIQGNRIAKIGTLKKNQAVETIDASNLVVTPGFIDVHTHCDRGIKRVPTEEEMTQMKTLIDQEMRSGGLGFSTRLSYLPGIYSKTEEIIEIEKNDFIASSSL